MHANEDKTFRWQKRKNIKMLFPCQKKLFIKVSMVRRSRLVIFYFREMFCDSHASAIDTRSHLQDVYF